MLVVILVHAMERGRASEGSTNSLPLEITGQDGASMVLVPGGSFTMGSDSTRPDEKPAHEVVLDAFYIDRYEVTNRLYGTFMEATGAHAPVHWEDERVNAPDQPVVGVRWYDARAYCAWAGKRLPTEAEWEKAARGSDGRRYPWGDEWGGGRAHVGQDYRKSSAKPAPVGAYDKGQSPYGVYGMAGNVWEWVQDWYSPEYYAKSPRRNPEGPPEGRYKVFRGGSWVLDARFARSAYRDKNEPGYRHDGLGFRCAKTP